MKKKVWQHLKVLAAFQLLSEQFKMLAESKQVFLVFQFWMNGWNNKLELWLKIVNNWLCGLHLKFIAKILLKKKVFTPITIIDSYLKW